MKSKEQYITSDSKNDNELKDPILHNLVVYLNYHFTENITVNQMAQRGMLSPYHFIRVFKKETGYTPHEYIVNLRISSAKYMLMTTEHLVKDICFDAGFSSESAFCKTFKKYTGKTPVQYRQNHMNYHKKIADSLNEAMLSPTLDKNYIGYKEIAIKTE